MKSLLIQDTTKEEREEIVRNALGWGVGCEDPGDGYEFYLPYIEGTMELRELNDRYRPAIVKAAPDEPGRSCPGGME